MKKFIFICLLFILSISLVSCASIDLTTSDKIEPPSESIIINGEWKVKEYKWGKISAVDEMGANNYIGKSAVFSKDSASILGEQCIAPRYKIKNEDALEYFYYNYKINPEVIGIKHKSVQVITISSNKNFFKDIIRVDNNTLLIYMDGIFLFLKNEHNETNNKDEKENELVQEKNKNKSSGLLLSLKSYEKSIVKYRTVWISNDGNIKPVEEIPIMLVPRKNGFWILDIKKYVGKNYSYEYLFPYPISKKDKIISDEQKYDSSRSVDIKFIGNDFISIESIKEDEKSSKILKVLPIDILYAGQEKTVKISEIMGVKGLETLNLGASSLISTFNDNDKKIVNKVPDETSFAIVRDSGRWVVKGRLNSTYESPSDYYIDFDVPIIPPRDIVAYDTLYPSWNIIKQKEPLAIDAYSSPNQDLEVVLTKDKLLVYGVKENQLKDKPEAEIKLKSNEVPIMAQWATGEYVKNWGEQVKELKK